MNNFDLQTYLSDKRKLVDEALENYLAPKHNTPEILTSAMKYSALAPGKRLRPILVIAAAETLNGSQDDVMPTACAFELIHAFSLIHDDLPALDNDDLRRGRPTCHKQYDEATAILAGDALLAHAFVLISNNASLVHAERVIRTINVVARSCGLDGMVAGQIADIQAEQSEPNADMVEYIHSKKTAAFIQAATASGAILAGGDDNDVARLSKYGYAVGMAFQIADDILNVEGDPQTLGKAVGSDEAHGKATYPSVFGLDNSKAQAATLIDEAVETVSSYGNAAIPLIALARYAIHRAW